jgi:NADH-quinone oxidoreductase subunit H
MFLPAAAVWLVVPFAPRSVVADLNVGIVFFIALTSIGALGLIMAGYGSRSTFSLLGAMRGAAQMISYEVPLILSLLGVIMLAGSLSFQDVVESQSGGFWHWYFLPQLPMFITFYIAGVAEARRVPFDLPEGESEIVGGFMVEYSGMTWGLIQASEFASMALVSAITATLFLGGWQPPLSSGPRELQLALVRHQDGAHHLHLPVDPVEPPAPQDGPAHGSRLEDTRAGLLDLAVRHRGRDARVPFGVLEERFSRCPS